MKKILVVDDEANIRFLLETILNLEGYKTTTAANGEEALAFASNRSFDLALIDLILPGMDGIETMLLLRAKQPGLRIMAMSGGWNGGEQSCLPLAGKLGACQTLEKPFCRSKLLDAVKEEIGKPGHLAANGRNFSRGPVPDMPRNSYLSP